MYAAIRQGKAKAGMAEELARRIKGGSHPDYQRCARLSGLLRDLCTGRHGDGDQYFRRLRRCPGIKQTRACLDRTEPGASAHRAGHSGGRTGDCAYLGLMHRASLGARSSTAASHFGWRIVQARGRHLNGQRASTPAGESSGKRWNPFRDGLQLGDRLPAKQQRNKGADCHDHQYGTEEDCRRAGVRFHQKGC